MGGRHRKPSPYSKGGYAGGELLQMGGTERKTAWAQAKVQAVTSKTHKASWEGTAPP